MTTSIKNEIMEEYTERFKRLIKDNVNYIVTDKEDPRVGIYAQEVVLGSFESFLFSALTRIQDISYGIK